LFDHAGAIDQKNERFGAAVHDGNFRAVQFDNGIIDAATGQRRHQMFDGADGAVVIIADHGAETRIDDGIEARGNVARAILQIDAPKQNACIGFGGDQGHIDGGCPNADRCRCKGSAP
jgi:hypothetical protein